MARPIKASEIVTRAKERADMEHSAFISDAEWYRMLDTWTAKLWSLLVNIDPDRYTTEQTITGDGTTTDFEVPSDYYGTVGVDYVSDSSQGIYVTIPRLFGQEITKISLTQNHYPSGYTFAYNTSNPELEILRILPSFVVEVRHRYIVAPPRLVVDNSYVPDTLVAGIAGFEEYVILGMAVDAVIKEKSSAAQLRKSLDEMKAHLEAMAENRAADTAGHVQDVNSGGYVDAASVRWATWE